jgi:hypothetical protein
MGADAASASELQWHFIQRLTPTGSLGCASVVKQLFAGFALGIDAGNFLDPANPPIIVLLYDGRILRRHWTFSGLWNGKTRPVDILS